MARVSTFTVVPRLPEKVEKLREIAFNLWWCWEPEAIALFFRIDRDLWEKTNQSPVQLLGQVDQKRLDALAGDESFLAHLDGVSAKLDDYLRGGNWREKNPDAIPDFNVAYFCAEFGLHESVSTYSGGLGVLAGDHLKSASDLGLPLVGVGLLHREGFHRQYLSADGWQQERYPRKDFYNMPLIPERDEQGLQRVVEVQYPDSTVRARIWRCQVGRIPLYLLDCDFDENDEDDREITARLYGGDRDVRIRQEILLGMGGVKALRALSIHPTAYHINEGHAAFLTLQLVRELVCEDGLAFEHAVEVVKAATVFTTHTPLAAGNDMFAPEMMAHYFSSLTDELEISSERFLAMGRQNPEDPREPFCLTVLALRLSAAANGVSQLHGETARAMWARTWPDIPESEVPITHITNGVHPRFWVSRDVAGLYDRYLGPAWIANPADPAVWACMDDVPDPELWRTHERRRERLVNFVRRRAVAQLHERGAPQSEIRAASEALDPEVLTIGLARRFTTYKRANLFMMDAERFARLLGNEDGPVQMIVAGKAHPQDDQAKELIRRIIHFIWDHGLRNRLIFIEDYDINVARYLVQGVDCWLSTPRRPLEASGTSGMKAAANGVLNISILDGWWDEAAHLGENGWSIGHGEVYKNPDEQDVVESEALYKILEQEAVPTFYDRGRDGLPRRWVTRMKTSIKTICPRFNTHRMVQEYTNRFYLPCATRRNVLCADGRGRSLNLTTWKQRVRAAWHQVHFTDVESAPTEALPFGSDLCVRADLFLGELSSDDVTVEIYYGDVDPMGRLVEGKHAEMQYTQQLDGGIHQFEGAISCDKTGQRGFTVRAIPSHPDLAQKHETALITWA